MATIEVNDLTKRIFEKFKTKYEKKYGKITWKDFMELIAYEIGEGIGHIRLSPINL